MKSLLDTAHHNIDDLTYENDTLKASVKEKDDLIAELQLKLADPGPQKELAKLYKENG